MAGWAGSRAVCWPGLRLALVNVAVETRRWVGEIDIVGGSELAEQLLPNSRLGRPPFPGFADIPYGQGNAVFRHRSPDDRCEVLEEDHVIASGPAYLLLSLLGPQDRIFLGDI